MRLGGGRKAARGAPLQCLVCAPRPNFAFSRLLDGTRTLRPISHRRSTPLGSRVAFLGEFCRPPLPPTISAYAWLSAPASSGLVVSGRSGQPAGPGKPRDSDPTRVHARVERTPTPPISYWSLVATSQHMLSLTAARLPWYPLSMVLRYFPVSLQAGLCSSSTRSKGKRDELSCKPIANRKT
jgi:hypothetical protein